MPGGFGLDILNQIVNVQWGGQGRFVSTANRSDNTDTTIRFLDAAGPAENYRWQNIPLGAFGSDGQAYAVAYGGIKHNDDGTKTGMPTFVAVGSEHSGSTEERGIIMVSNNGTDWHQVYTGRQPAPPCVGSWVFAAVWDGNKFWAAAHESERGSGIETADKNEIDILLSSADGSSWSVSGRNIINITQWDSYSQSSGLLIPHCDPTVKDDFGNALPDGIWDQTKDRKTRIQPTTALNVDYLFGGISRGGLDSNVKITRQTEDGETVEEMSMPIPVSAIANAGTSLWVAVGGTSSGGMPRSAISVDNGKTWKELTVSGNSDVMNGVVGADKSDFNGT